MTSVRFGLSLLALLFAVLAPVACSSSDDGKTTSPTSSGSSTSTSQTCHTPFACIGGSCQCSGGPNKDKSCCDPESGSCSSDGCDSICKYCE